MKEISAILKHAHSKLGRWIVRMGGELDIEPQLSLDLPGPFDVAPTLTEDGLWLEWDGMRVPSPGIEDPGTEQLSWLDSDSDGDLDMEAERIDG